jgi:hypothetical protein
MRNIQQQLALPNVPLDKSGIASPKQQVPHSRTRWDASLPCNPHPLLADYRAYHPSVKANEIPRGLQVHLLVFAHHLPCLVQTNLLPPCPLTLNPQGQSHLNNYRYCQIPCFPSCLHRRRQDRKRLSVGMYLFEIFSGTQQRLLHPHGKGKAGPQTATVAMPQQLRGKVTSLLQHQGGGRRERESRNRLYSHLGRSQHNKYYRWTK